MSWKLNIRRAAEVEITEAWLFFESKRQGLGDLFLERLDEKLIQIAETPELYALETNEIRKVRLRQFPYVLGYFIDVDQVVVLGLLHGSRNPQEWADKLK